MENQAVYRDVHALVLDLVRSGKVDGLRVDHPDGLRNPRLYLERLRTDAPDAWLIVEKVLEPGEDETLPITYPVQGTTGYDFLNRVNGLFVDPDGEAPLTEFYTAFTGRISDYAQLVHDTKLFAAQALLGPDLNRLTELFLQVCERHRLYRDTTRDELKSVLAETAACLPVYRTYVETGIQEPEEGQLSEMDSAYIDQAIEGAKSKRTELDPRLFDFFGNLLKRKVPGAMEEDLLARFQQFTGPVMAKGVEDRAFYIFNRFVSLNEVGGDPGRFGFTVDDFHRTCQETQVYWPETLLATSTHDTKRSEDVRARLNVISEMHGEWVEAVRRWAEMNEEQRKGEYPDRNAEYLLYQILVGAWPISADRAVEYMRKAGREAGTFTNWVAPEEEYDGAVEGFVRAILSDSRFTADLETFVAEVLAAGRINSLSQTLLKLTSPGIPDIYQGTEIWDLSLVDPDNRRLVDFGLRRKLLRMILDDSTPEAILAGMDRGLPKLWVIRRALALRKQHPEWFDAGSGYTPVQIEHQGVESPPEHPREEPAQAAVYEPGEPEAEALLVAVTGSPQPVIQEPAVAFLRGMHVLVAVPRLVTRFRAEWERYSLVVPSGNWRNWLTHASICGGTISLAALFEQFPVALLVKEEING
jgi:(1->4)-alpha-D-glucan 1-alpha-D-glucosylmutase